MHGKYRRGTCLAYFWTKRAEGQDVLKEGGRRASFPAPPVRLEWKWGRGRVEFPTLVNKRKKEIYEGMT